MCEYFTQTSTLRQIKRSKTCSTARQADKLTSLIETAERCHVGAAIAEVCEGDINFSRSNRWLGDLNDAGCVRLEYA